MNTFKLTFYLCLISSIMVFIFGIITKSLIINIKPIGWIISLLLALLAGLGGVTLYQIGIKTIGPQNTSILSTFEPITSIVLSVLILNEPFTIKTAIGIVLILAAVILVSIFEKGDENKYKSESA